MQDADDALSIPTELLNSHETPGLPAHKLKLKKGMVVMLLRNLNPIEGLCNGTRLLVEDVIEGRLLAVKIASPGVHHGELRLIPRINLMPEEGIFPYRWRRRQFPVRASFAMTINKSQGQVRRPPCSHHSLSCAPVPLSSGGYQPASRELRHCLRVGLVTPSQPTPSHGSFDSSSCTSFTWQTLQRVGVFLDEPCFSHGQLYVAASRVGHPERIKFALASEAGVFETANVVYRDALSNNDPVPDGFVVDEDATDLDEPASDDPSLSDRRGTCLAGVLRWPASRRVSPRTCSRPREHGTRAERAINPGPRRRR